MNERSRPCRGWTDDSVSWCKTGLQELTVYSAEVNQRKLESLGYSVVELVEVA